MAKWAIIQFGNTTDLNNLKNVYSQNNLIVHGCQILVIKCYYDELAGNLFEYNFVVKRDKKNTPWLFVCFVILFISHDY